MKIYFVANARMPNKKAHGIQLALMCEQFIAQGIDLVLLLPKAKKFVRSTIREYYDLKYEIPIKMLPAISMAQSSSLGFNIRALSFAFSSFFYLIFKYLLGERNAICYTIDLDQFSFFLLPLAGFHTYIEVHGSKKRTWFTRFFFRLADGIITNSSGVKMNIAKSFNWNIEDILTAPNGIDIQKFKSSYTKLKARDMLGLSKKNIIVLYVGRFYNWKGLEIIAQTTPFVPREVQWVLVGGDSDDYKKACGANLPSQAIALGDKPHTEIPIWLRASDALLVLGTHKNEYSWQETSPMKLFEYMASQRPIIASATPANKEIVNSKEVFFYEPDNQTSLANAVSSAVAGNKEIIDSKTKSAYKKASEYTWEKRVKNILHYINSNINT
jgi:glycosyltransferase involved in cell wall biosynthesis